MEAIPEESERVLAKAKFPNWLYWRYGYVQGGLFYYQMTKRPKKSARSKEVTPETQIKLISAEKKSDPIKRQ